MGEADSRDKDSVTEVAGQAFVRERPPEIERGTVLAGRYQIEDIIGKGGSGIVLRVFDRVAQNVVALKVLKSELARDAKWEKRFSRELRLGRPIQHPNVCRIFDIGEADGYRFLTMELASGGSLRDELKRTRALERPLEERLADARAVIAGLAALHGAGVVHRDFKPDNILRMGDGRLVLSDFGLATDAANAPGATVLIGTPHYMAPEVLGGEPASARSDVWALGVVLHEIFFGRRPERRSVSFDGSGKGPLRPSTAIERAMLALCDRCLLEAPIERPTDATVVAKMLESARPSRRGGAQRSQAPLVRYGLAALIVTGAGGWAAWHHRRSIAPANPQPSASGPLTMPPRPSADWKGVAKVVTEVAGRVHCFAITDAKTAQIVWGNPRRAEEVDLETGRRRAAHLLPETYQVDCPSTSPSGSALLFTGLTPAGAKEIRMSETPDGRGATMVTSGAEPVWLGRQDEFLYLIDPSHVAVFSLPTMTFALLPEGHLDGHPLVADKAVSKDGGTVAVLLYGEDSTPILSVYQGRSFAPQTTLRSRGLLGIQFGETDREILAVENASGPGFTLADLDWRERTFRNVVAYSGYDVVGARFAGEREMLLVRRALKDAWLVDETHRARLTSDGLVFSAARSRAGDLLLSKPVDGGLSIWWQGHDGTSRRLTHGIGDVAPNFSPDGRLWTYADYAQKDVMLCTSTGDSCRVLRNEPQLPAWPVFSPDGDRIAYLTLNGSTQLTIVSADDGHYQVSWDASYQCPPVWSSARTLWSLEVKSGHRVWFERDLTGRKTGKRFDAPAEGEALDESQCWPRNPSASPFAPPVHVEVEQTSSIVSLPN